MNFAISLENLQNQLNQLNKLSQQNHGCMCCNNNTCCLNNSSNLNLQLTKQDKTINACDAAKEFCNLYYHGMSTKGCSGVLYLFSQDALCNYNGKECIGYYNVMTTMATEGIARAFYDKLHCVVLPINNDQINLQITGFIQGVTFWGQYTSQYLFTETFILTLKNNNIMVTSYSTKLI